MTEADKIAAKEILSRAKLRYGGVGIYPFHPIWANTEDVIAAFAIANRRGNVGGRHCRACHAKAWMMLHVITQDE